MSWRVWLFRSLAMIFLAACAGVGWFVYVQANSGLVRAKAVELIRAEFPGADVQIGAAWVRPLGGLWLSDVRLFRRDDPSHPFVIIPSAVIYHDKEKLARGRLAIRKVELTQPTIQLRRDADGNWNIPLLPRPTGPASSPVPTLLIRRGTIRFEDHSGGLSRASLEVNDIQLTCINDPIKRVSFQGQAESLVGSLKLSGSHDRESNLLTLACDIPAYALTSQLVQQLGEHFSDVRQHLSGLEGVGDAHLDLHYQPGIAGGLQPDLRVNLHHGRFSHPKLPLSPLSEIELCAHYHDGKLTIEKGAARSGSTRATLNLEATLPLDGPVAEKPEEFLSHFELSIEKLNVTKEIFDQLPPDIQRMNSDFHPTGQLGLTFKFDKGESSWRRTCIVRAEGLTAQYYEFPYVLRDIRGELEQVSTSEGNDELRVRLKGKAAGKVVTIDGGSQNSRGRFKLDLQLRGNGIVIDEELKAAMLENRAGVEAFHPVGEGDFVARIRRSPGEVMPDMRIDVQFHKLAICYDEFPYAFDDVAGTMHVHLGPETKFTFDKFHATHAGGEVVVSGTHEFTSRMHEVRLHVHAAMLPFDSGLNNAFRKVHLEPALATMRPRGNLGFDGDLIYVAWNAQPGAPKARSRLQVIADKCTVDSANPDFLPYELENISCAFHYDDGDGKVVKVADFRADHRSSSTKIQIGSKEFPSTFVIKPNGGIQGLMQQIQVAPLVVDEELLAALPPGMRSACMSLEPSGSMTLFIEQFGLDTTADYPDRNNRSIVGGNVQGVRLSSASLRDEGPSPWMSWKSAYLRFGNASIRAGIKCDNVYGLICVSGDYRFGHLNWVRGNLEISQASIRRQPVRNLHCHVSLDQATRPGLLRFEDLSAKAYSGNVIGEVNLWIEPVVRYNVRLNATQLRLEEIDRLNQMTSDGRGNGQLSGLAKVQLVLNGHGSELTNLSGGGSFDVPDGRIYNLPPLLDLLKFARLRAPDGTFFEEAKGDFRIHGDTMLFDKLDLFGDLISLTGDGEMKLDGTKLRLNVYTVWSRIDQLLPGPARDLPTSISRNLYKIEMRGSIYGPLEFRQEAVPFLVEPAKRLLDRLRQMH
jgi:hypothetical protein